MKKSIWTVLLLTCLLTAACRGGETTPETEKETVTKTDAAQETAVTATVADQEEESEDVPADGSYEGIVIDAAMHSLTLYTADAKMIMAGLPEEGVQLKDGLLLGIPVKVVFQDGEVTEVTDGTAKPLASREALSFAGSVLYAMQYQDLDTLAALAAYPVYVNEDGGVTAEDAEAFLAMDPDAIFKPERVKAVLAVNLYELKELDGGKYVMGDGTPNVTFQADEGNDRGFSITGIN